MKQEGPPLQRLTHRLGECPPEFLESPRVGNRDGIHVAAVVSDVVRDLGGGVLRREAAAPFEIDDERGLNRLRLILIASWLLHDDWFRERRDCALASYHFLVQGLNELATLVESPQFVRDADRREELARLCLRALDLRPQGETVPQATDRLNSLDSAARDRVIRESRAAQERARKIREEMARKAAEEAAAQYGRE